MSVALSPDLSAADIRLSKPQSRTKPGDITVRNAAADAFALLLTEAEILAVPVAPSPVPDTARTPAAIATPAAPHLPRPIADQPSEFPDIFDTFQRHPPEEGAILPLPGDGQTTPAEFTAPDGIPVDTTPAVSIELPPQTVIGPHPKLDFAPHGLTYRAQPVDRLSLSTTEPAHTTSTAPPKDRPAPAISPTSMGDSMARADESTEQSGELGRVLTFYESSFAPAAQGTDVPPIAARPQAPAVPSATPEHLPLQRRADHSVTTWRAGAEAVTPAQPQPLATPVQDGAAPKTLPVASPSRSSPTSVAPPAVDGAPQYNPPIVLTTRTVADAHWHPVNAAPAPTEPSGPSGPALPTVTWSDRGGGADRAMIAVPRSPEPTVAVTPRMAVVENGAVSRARPGVALIGAAKARPADQVPHTPDHAGRDPVVRATPPPSPPLRSALPEPTVTDTATAALQRSDVPPHDSALRITETPSTPSPRILAAHIATQVAQAAQAQPNGTTDVTLNPKELGQVRLSLQAVDTTISILIVAERPETAELMRRHIDTLAQEFRGLGYQDISFSFGGRHGGQGDAPPQNRFAGTPQDGAGVQREDLHAPAPDHADRYIPRRAAVQNSGRGLDLRL